MSEQNMQAMWRNTLALPGNLFRSIVRHGRPDSARARSQAVFSNLFLHIHSTRIHHRTLRFSTTADLGAISASLFLILTGTGIFLMVYYKPSVDGAYDSIKDIHYVIPTGRLTRNIHRWAAHLMVLSVILHMCRVFFTASYKKPREFNWLVGMGLLVVTLALSFTGYLLPWDQLAYWAITIGANIAASPRELTDALGMTAWFDPGGFTREMLLGASEVGPEALIRFNLLHCVILPIAAVVLLGVHFWRIRKDGGLGRPHQEVTPAGKGAAVSQQAGPAPVSTDSANKTWGLMALVPGRSPAADIEPSETVPAWPYLLRAELLVFMGTMLLCLVLGIFFDAPLKVLADPVHPENPAKAPWYFLGLQELVSYSAFVGGLFIPAVTVVGLGLVPYLDREKEPAGIYLDGAHNKRIALHSALFGTLCAVLAVAIPVNFGWLRDWFPGVPQLFIILFNPGTLLTAAYVAWSLRVAGRTGSTRSSAIALFTCFLMGFIILTYVGTELRGPNWDFYWSRSDWPVH